MKLSNIQKTADIAVRVPLFNKQGTDVLKDAEGNEAFVTVYSKDSEAGQALDNKFRKDTMRDALAENRSKRRGVRQLDREAEKTLEKLDEQSLEYCVSLTEDWYLLTLEGDLITEEDEVTPLACTERNKRVVFEHPALEWIRDQVEEAITDQENFTSSS